jgi:DNA-binding response OmpR family regulator
VKTSEAGERVRVLIAGEGPDWGARVRAALAESPLELVTAESGAEVLDLVGRSEGDVSLIVLNGSLPDMSGLAVSRSLRECKAGGSILILLVSRWGDEMDRILAFESGADDFALDPFFPRELASRVQALLRRGRSTHPKEPPPQNRVGPLHVDAEKALVEVEGRSVSLTFREFELLRLLVRERGRVVRRAELVGHLLGAPDAASPRLIDTHVKSIRRKLGDAGGLIETVRGVGYRLAPTRGLQGPE